MRRRGVVAALLGCVAFQAVLIRWPGSAVLMYPLVLVPVITVGAVRFHRRAQVEQGRGRRVARLGAVAMVTWLTGFVWGAVAAMADLSEEIRLGGVIALAQVPLALAVFAVFSLPGAPSTPAGRLRIVADGMVVSLSAFGVSWVLLLRGWYQEQSEEGGRLLLLGICLALITVLSIAVLLLVHAGWLRMTMLTGLVVGIGAITLASLAMMLAAFRGEPHHDLVAGALHVFGALAITAAARLPLPTQDLDGAGPTSLRAQLFPYVVFLPLSVVGVTDLLQRANEPVLTMIGLLLVGAILVRQFVVFRTNTRLATELSEQRNRLARQEFHDPLTGLANRALFSVALEQALRPGRPRPALLVVDLDGFKAVNDTRGNAVGDQVLVAVAGRLRDCVRATDTVARLGGDEFAVLLAGVATPDDAIGVAAVILDRLQTPLATGLGHEEAPAAVDATVTPRASVGIALAEEGVGSADALLRDAEMALHEAKSDPRTRYRVADRELSESTLGRMRLESELRRALESIQFEVHYQPIVDLTSERTVGAEALLRWRHPKRGLIGPVGFIEAAEAAGLLPEMDRFVLVEACRKARSWRRTVPDFYVSVNVCAEHLIEATLVDDVAAALAGADLPPRALMLEVTETALVADLTVAARALRELADLGVRIALDDFGTGYSSLTYLRTLPIHILKIDRSFVRNLGGTSDRTDEAVTRAILGLTETLELRSVAEGVERVDQADRLRELRCGYAQGYLFGRPMPPAEFTTHLAVRNHPSDRPDEPGRLGLDEADQLHQPGESRQPRPVA